MLDRVFYAQSSAPPDIGHVVHFNCALEQFKSGCEFAQLGCSIPGHVALNLQYVQVGLCAFRVTGMLDLAVMERGLALQRAEARELSLIHI
eukprot:5754639-Pyramimonas_sp.AAC.1